MAYLLQEEATLKEKKVNGCHIKPYIACAKKGSQPAVSNIQLKLLKTELRISQTSCNFTQCCTDISRINLFAGFLGRLAGVRQY